MYNKTWSYAINAKIRNSRIIHSKIFCMNFNNIKIMNIYTENLKDKFTLSPFEKYAKYGRFPYKFLIACVLVFLTTLQVILISEHYTYNNPD